GALRVLRAWRGNPRGAFLAGGLTMFSVSPEVVGFTIVAGVDPILGLYTSIVFLVLMSFLGGRPAMVSAGAGSMAVVVVSLIRDYGLSYLFAAVLLTGVIQLVLGALRVGNLIRFVPPAVVAGFVDALAIIIFRAQVESCLTHLGVTPSAIVMTLLLIAAGLVLIYLFPRFTRAFPSTLFSIIVITVLWLIVRAVGGGALEITMISDLGDLTAKLPAIGLPAVPFSLETLKIIAPYSVSLAFVGLLETLLTARVVDEMTATESRKNRECRAQGIGNMVCGLIGAMPGCAMIGQAIANVSSGGRGRLSTLTAGCLLTVLLVAGAPVLGAIPLAALIAVMVAVSIATFDWKNLKEICGGIQQLISGGGDRTILFPACVTILTVAVVVITDNLAFGVFAGLLLHFVFWIIRRAKRRAAA
ncbi:MAG: sulfate permease, partial [Oscillospiraceae bacterium]|nr:sulfate permease [Oscillospiraceae bacterium]